MSDGIDSYFGPRPLRPIRATNGLGAYFSPQTLQPVTGTSGLGAYFSPQTLQPVSAANGLGVYTRRGVGAIPEAVKPLILLGVLAGIIAIYAYSQKGLK